jgi:hypothetical protein
LLRTTELQFRRIRFRAKEQQSSELLVDNAILVSSLSSHGQVQRFSQA